MIDISEPIKTANRCAFIRVCYLAEGLMCYGYKTDCVLYRRSNGEICSAVRFDEAMNRLIDRTRAKHLDIKVEELISE